MQTYEKVHTSISTFQTNFDLDSFDYEEYYFSFLKFSNLYIYIYISFVNKQGTT